MGRSMQGDDEWTGGGRRLLELCAAGQLGSKRRRVSVSAAVLSVVRSTRVDVCESFVSLAGWLLSFKASHGPASG